VHGYFASGPTGPEAVHLMVARKLEGKYSLQGHVTSDLLSPARSHLLKFPEPPKIVPLAGDQPFNNEPMGGGYISYLTITPSLWIYIIP
jgi:hypothetical protein